MLTPFSVRDERNYSEQQSFVSKCLVVGHFFGASNGRQQGFLNKLPTEFHGIYSLLRLLDVSSNIVPSFQEDKIFVERQNVLPPLNNIKVIL